MRISGLDGSEPISLIFNVIPYMYIVVEKTCPPNFIKILHILTDTYVWFNVKGKVENNYIGYIAAIRRSGLI